MIDLYDPDYFQPFPVLLSVELLSIPGDSEEKQEGDVEYWKLSVGWVDRVYTYTMRVEYLDFDGTVGGCSSGCNCIVEDYWKRGLRGAWSTMESALIFVASRVCRGVIDLPVLINPQWSFWSFKVS